MNRKARVIAFYLPQFYPFKENDEWWGKGFTEWTNVGKAKSLFKGHNQPRVPTELGYYDLRMPIIREQQAELAREAGITAFCYWHYWFGNGKRLLEQVFDEVLESGKPDFPFCLGWANHSWYAKTWDSNSQKSDKLLIEQTYPGKEDARKHFDYLLKAFKDPRYLRVEGKPLFYIFNPKDLPKEYLNCFRKWAVEEGMEGLFVVAQLSPIEEPNDYVDKGYDAVSYQRIADIRVKPKFKNQNRLIHKWLRLKSVFRGKPAYCFDYSDFVSKAIKEIDKNENVFPEIVPQWDHSPRSGDNGTILVNAKPDLFYKHVSQALSYIKNKRGERQILFLKSWNEWGEGNYMEPDLTFGRGYIDALRRALEDVNNQ